ncbi:unnamed protein product [Prunus armeniaca]|uniref:KEN domain-containing protein n=1 Tax=Prunus armeniaca TaxID=36596 RepID=A0A6J5XFW9_PRUAR|nr:unnamed protein product [Prunus armeniaca]CAB4311393.1 unnamed protein product [Prunus armeniaca]
MDDQEEVFNFAKDEYERNESHDKVIGPMVCCYSLSFDSNISEESYKGFLYFKRNGKPIPVTFVKVDGVDGKDAASRAELIFHTTYGVSDDVVLRPRRHLFIKQKHFAKIPDDIEMRKGVWCVCYDRFEPLDKVKLPIRTPDDRPEDFWRISIRNLIHGVRNIHAEGLYHGGLNELSNFVFVDEMLKIINIERSLADLSTTREQNERKKKDIIDLRTMLDSWFKKILGSNYLWEECNSFLKFFDHAEHLNYHNFVEKLASHPFLLSSEERMGMFASYYRKCYQVNTRQDVEDAFESSDFDKFKSWNRIEVLGSMDKFMKEVYDNHYGTYSGNVVDLLSYLRNLYSHYHQSNALAVNIVDVDRGVQKLFAGFLELLHQHLCIDP